MAFRWIALACYIVTSAIGFRNSNPGFTPEEMKKSYDQLDRWLDDNVKGYDPEGIILSTVDQLSEGIQRKVATFVVLSHIEKCNDCTLGSIRIIVSATGIVAGKPTNKRINYVMRHF